MESDSCPIENHVDSRCSDLDTSAALRLVTAPDARWKTTLSARKLSFCWMRTDSTGLPRPRVAASRDEVKVYGPQLWCGE